MAIKFLQEIFLGYDIYGGPGCQDHEEADLRK
jgi:hypothetical protein